MLQGEPKVNFGEAKEVKLETERREVDQPNGGTREASPPNKGEVPETEKPAVEAAESPTLEEGEVEAAEKGEIGEERDTREAEIASLKEQVESLRSQLIRLHADFDNYRKRVRREQQEIRETATASLIKELLPVLDSLELALTAAKAGGEKEAFVSGVEMVWRQLLDVLGREGLTPIEAVGRPFDPFHHEAVATEEATEGGQYNVVTAELRKGYLLRGRLLRPALVKVAVPPAPPPATEFTNPLKFKEVNLEKTKAQEEHGNLSYDQET